jgi:hypothetical protein
MLKRLVVKSASSFVLVVSTVLEVNSMQTGSLLLLDPSHQRHHHLKSLLSLPPFLPLLLLHGVNIIPEQRSEARKRNNRNRWQKLLCWKDLLYNPGLHGNVSLFYVLTEGRIETDSDK